MQDHELMITLNSLIPTIKTDGWGTLHCEEEDIT